MTGGPIRGMTSVAERLVGTTRFPECRRRNRFPRRRGPESLPEACAPSLKHAAKDSNSRESSETGVEITACVWLAANGGVVAPHRPRGRHRPSRMERRGACMTGPGRTPTRGMRSRRSVRRAVEAHGEMVAARTTRLAALDRSRGRPSVGRAETDRDARPRLNLGIGDAREPPGRTLEADELRECAEPGTETEQRGRALDPPARRPPAVEPRRLAERRASAPLDVRSERRGSGTIRVAGDRVSAFGHGRMVRRFPPRSMRITRV